jgi:flagellar biogenesis protein FliO
MDGASLSTAASTLASLLAILFAFAGAAWLARRLRGRAPARGKNDQGPINIIANKPLGGGHMLVIAEAEGKRFLIGVSRDQMHAIGKLNHD